MTSHWPFHRVSWQDIFTVPLKHKGQRYLSIKHMTECSIKIIFSILHLVSKECKFPRMEQRCDKKNDLGSSLPIWKMRNQSNHFQIASNCQYHDSNQAASGLQTDWLSYFEKHPKKTMGYSWMSSSPFKWGNWFSVRSHSSPTKLASADICTSNFWIRDS